MKIDQKLKGKKMIEEHDLNETGKRGMRVIGEKIIDETTRRDRDGRWYRVQIIKAVDGYVIGTAMNTKYRGEHDRYWIDETKGRRSIIKILESHIPGADAGKREEVELRANYIAMIDRISEVILPAQPKPVA